MGCDIHMFVNYRRKDNSYGDYWKTFGGNIGPGRNYSMFGILAGVRSEYPDYCEPKGYPNQQMGWQCENEYNLNVTEDGRGDNETTLERAMEYNKNHHCKLYRDHDEKVYKVRNPDYHSPSWMTIAELSKAYRMYVTNEKKTYGRGKVPTEYRVVLDLMRSLEKTGEYEVKLVFWFDN